MILPESKLKKVVVINGEGGSMPIQDGPYTKGGVIGRVPNGTVILVPIPMFLTEQERRDNIWNDWVQCANLKNDDIFPSPHTGENWIDTKSHVKDYVETPPVTPPDTGTTEKTAFVKAIAWTPDGLKVTYRE